MIQVLLIIVALAGVVDASPAKSRTDRFISETFVVNVPSHVAYESWLDPKSVKSFFAPDAVIDPREGGAYTIIFDPLHDPTGDVAGTRGAKILKMVPDRFLSFEWNAGVPWIAPELKTPEFPTWVELEFEPADDSGKSTRVIFHHYGFRTGENWDRVFAWFQQEAWPSVFRDLKSYCNDNQPKKWQNSK